MCLYQDRCGSEGSPSAGMRKEEATALLVAGCCQTATCLRTVHSTTEACTCSQHCSRTPALRPAMSAQAQMTACMTAVLAATAAAHHMRAWPAGTALQTRQGAGCMAAACTSCSWAPARCMCGGSSQRMCAAALKHCPCMQDAATHEHATRCSACSACGHACTAMNEPTDRNDVRHAGDQFEPAGCVRGSAEPRGAHACHGRGERCCAKGAPAGARAGPHDALQVRACHQMFAVKQEDSRSSCKTTHLAMQ